MAQTIAGDVKSRAEVSETATVDRLLDSAAALFWEKGYAATTTREIAAALHIQQASLYYHIASKEDLLHKLCTSCLEEFVRNIPPAVNGFSDPLKRIKAIIHAHITTLLRNQKQNATMLTELRALSGRARAEVMQLRETYTLFVRSALEDGQKAGKIRGDIPARYLCLALLNMLNWSALWFRKVEINKSELALSADELAEIFVKILLDGVAIRTRKHASPAAEMNLPMKPARPRRIVKSAETATLKRLLTAAVALFSRKGYAATSTREVAGLLGIQKASLYYHIESKEDLLYAICKSSLEQIHSDVKSAVNEIRDPLERTRTLISSHLESMLRDQQEHTTTLSEMRSLSKDRFKDVLALRHAYEDLVRSVLVDGQRAGVLRDDIDAKFLCLALLGLMNRVLVWYQRRKALSPAQLGQVLSVIFLTGAAA